MLSKPSRIQKALRPTGDDSHRIQKVIRIGKEKYLLKEDGYYLLLEDNNKIKW